MDVTSEVVPICRTYLDTVFNGHNDIIMNII